MREIKIEVSEQAEEIFFATNQGWKKVVGHTINIEEFKFSVVPLGDFFRISELESGAKIFDLPVPDSVQDYEETMFFLETTVGIKLFNFVEDIGHEKLRTAVEQTKLESIKTCGEKPVGITINMQTDSSTIH